MPVLSPQLKRDNRDGEREEVERERKSEKEGGGREGEGERLCVEEFKMGGIT